MQKQFRHKRMDKDIKLYATIVLSYSLVNAHAYNTIPSSASGDSTVTWTASLNAPW